MAATSRTTGWFSSASGEGLVISTKKRFLNPRVSGPRTWAEAVAAAARPAQTARIERTARAAGRLGTFGIGCIGGISFPGRNTGPILHHFRRKRGALGDEVRLEALAQDV